MFQPRRLAAFAELVFGIRNPARIANNAVIDFKPARRRAHIDELVCGLHELAEIQRTVVQRAW